MSLDDDEKLILQNDQTLRAAGVGKNLSLAENCNLQSESERKQSDSGFKLVLQENIQVKQTKTRINRL